MHPKYYTAKQIHGATTFVMKCDAKASKHKQSYFSMNDALEKILFCIYFYH